MNSYKIGLCLAFKGSNYGQLLQAYATQEIIQKLGYNTEIIDYHSGANKGIKPSLCAVHVFLKHLLNTIHPSKNDVVLDDIHKMNIKQRTEVSNQFRKTRLKNIVVCNGIDELKEKSGQYYAVIVGSDQLWLPDVSASNFYTLRFAKSGVRRISYATSLGVSEYPWYAKRSAADFLKDINYISVREEEGKKIIQSIIDVPVEVVADPTYLLTEEEWETRIPYEQIEESGYILSFILGDDKAVKDYARNFANKKGLRVVSILSNESNSEDSIYADKVLTGKTPEEFVNLIRHADYVLTDSFHGLAFSVINQKQFVVFYRKRVDAKGSRNSRIDNIVRSWGIEDRLIREPEKMIIPAGEIDYQAVSTKVQELRTKSLQFLKNALNA